MPFVHLPPKFWWGVDARQPRSGPPPMVLQSSVHPRRSLRVSFSPPTLLLIPQLLQLLTHLSHRLNSPARFRPTVATLAKLTAGRCFSINYRLAPQHPFPAALLDVIIAYLSLIYPLPGAYHSPVSPSSVVTAGDSSGSCLSLALIQVIIAIRQIQATDAPLVRFHGREVILAMPSGLALQSPLVDQTNSLPSWNTNGRFDVVQQISPLMLPDYPTCPIWPSHPPRGDVYCETEMLSHPLVSPLVARTWAGAPPLWLALGEERMVDAAKVVA
ncbi:hypothetical protein MMC28_008803 [Mycoblastus sanguinarius]|nr:hypothetical protein [Mycoblastus sanguinarius]